MAKTIDDAVAALQTIVGAISGIRSAPDEPPERAAAFPFIICHQSTGTFETETANDGTDTAVKGLHTIVLQLHVARRDLPRAYAKAIPYPELIKNVIFKQANLTLSGTIDTIVSEISYTFGDLEYGGVDTLGYIFQIPVKIKNDTATT